MSDSDQQQVSVPCVDFCLASCGLVWRGQVFNVEYHQLPLQVNRAHKPYHRPLSIHEKVVLVWFSQEFSSVTCPAGWERVGVAWERRRVERWGRAEYGLRATAGHGRGGRGDQRVQRGDLRNGSVAVHLKCPVDEIGPIVTQGTATTWWDVSDWM